MNFYIKCLFKTVPIFFFSFSFSPSFFCRTAVQQRTHTEQKWKINKNMPVWWIRLITKLYILVAQFKIMGNLIVFLFSFSNSKNKTKAKEEKMESLRYRLFVYRCACAHRKSFPFSLLFLLTSNLLNEIHCAVLSHSSSAMQ